MNKLNHKTRTQTRKKIEPSSRDSISTWLDVLTAMLVMPDTQRAQVRDELEDHLRSRVDDLLIVGKPEPEAIRIAVAELGETAQLAKLITHAHTKSNPRRKIMNAALITVALAGMSFGGFSFINATGAPSATPSNGGAVPVVVPGETKRDDGTYLFDIQEVKIAEALAGIAEAFDLNLRVGDDVKRGFQQSNKFFARFSIQGEMTLAESVKAIQRSSEAALLDYVIKYDQNEVSVFTQDKTVRRTVTTVVSPAPYWIKDGQQRLSYTESIKDILRVKHDLEFASIQIIGKSFVVSAPPEIHLDVDRIVRELEVIAEKDSADRIVRANLYQEKREAENKARQEEQAARSLIIAQEKKAKQQEAIGRIQVEFDRVRTEFIQKKSMMNELGSRLRELNNAFEPELSTKRHDREILEIENALVDTQLLHDEYESRYHYLRDTLIESEYTELFKGLE